MQRSRVVVVLHPQPPGAPQTGADFGDEGGRGRESVRGIGRKAAVSGFGILRRSKADPFRGPWKHPELETRPNLAVRGGRVYVTRRSENENGNSV